MRFSAPTMARPSAAVIASPTNRLSITANMSRPERSANHRMSSTAIDRQGHVEQGAVGDRAELLVGHGDRPGEAHAHALVLA